VRLTNSDSMRTTVHLLVALDTDREPSAVGIEPHRPPLAASDTTSANACSARSPVSGRRRPGQPSKPARADSVRHRFLDIRRTAGAGGRRLRDIEAMA
jgi:hypothetical protein